MGQKDVEVFRESGLLTLSEMKFAFLKSEAISYPMG